MGKIFDVIFLWIDIRQVVFLLKLILIQIDCVAENELTARINMADAKFSFQEKGKFLKVRLKNSIDIDIIFIDTLSNS